MYYETCAKTENKKNKIKINRYGWKLLFLSGPQ